MHLSNFFSLSFGFFFLKKKKGKKEGKEREREGRNQAKIKTIPTHTQYFTNNTTLTTPPWTALPIPIPIPSLLTSVFFWPMVRERRSIEALARLGPNTAKHSVS